MDKAYKPQEFEGKIYNYWEKKKLLQAPSTGVPYTILMPPPNANASLHAGHGMYTVDDIMIRYKRLRGYASVWLPGMDHAGIETQFVYEKQLAKQGKSRMDFDRETLYKDIYQFVAENSGLIYAQFKKLGFLADWDRSVYTLDDHVLKRAFETFERLEREGLVYKDDYIVNYCTRCGTSLAELEVNHIERIDPLYYVRYPRVAEKGYITVATVRPEPIFIDTHLAVNPKDKKRKGLIGQKVKNPITDTEMEIIGDEFVDPKFGTGIVKLTPGHDPHDFEVAKKHGLPIRTAIDWTGRIMEAGGAYAGMKVKAARAQVIEDLKAKKLIEKINENYSHAVSVCYKCGRDLEPLVISNWFLKVAKLKQQVIKAVRADRVQFFPKKHKRHMLTWLDVMHDWPISRQNVWGIRIPVWYKVGRNTANIIVAWLDKKQKLQQGTVGDFMKGGTSLIEIERGLQRVYVVAGTKLPDYIVSQKKPGPNYLPETDTFDTWFSSGQWPLVTLKEGEYKDRFPTDFMGTLVDILKFWISRMIMFSLYLREEVPFKTVYLWPMVADAKGVKMSKSKGNVVNPIDLVERHGADAFRASLLFGISPGGKVILAEDKVRGMRNFANKIWNIGRLIQLNIRNQRSKSKMTEQNAKIVRKLHREFEVMKKQYIGYMEAYQFSKALGVVYEFLWHRFADHYLEQLKEPLKNGTITVQKELESVYLENIKLLHPFMPFVTEAVWQIFNKQESSILTSKIKVIY